MHFPYNVFDPSEENFLETVLPPRVPSYGVPEVRDPGLFFCPVFHSLEVLWHIQKITRSYGCSDSWIASLKAIV